MSNTRYQPPATPPFLGPNPATVRAPSDMIAWDHIPYLEELLPMLGGVPGFYYLQVALEGIKSAKTEGWEEVANSEIYTIVGPEGEITCKLMCSGQKIPGGNYGSSRRLCYIDKNIFECTGFVNGPEEPVAASKPKPRTAKKTDVDVEDVTAIVKE